MQENNQKHHINSYTSYKQRASNVTFFIIKNPACSIPVFTGCCAVMFVLSLFIFLIVFYYLMQH